MRQRGGEILGAGSQGCIFSPKLEYTKVGARVIARRSGNKTAISKVFSNKRVWEGEYAIMQAVRDAVVDARTGDVKGVVLYTPEARPFYTANNLNPENKALVETHEGTGCKSLRGATKYYVLNQPKIKGDLRDFQKPGKPKIVNHPHYFLNAYNALMQMRINGLVHMDIASRNIFYNEDSAFIGDFGYTINLFGDPMQLNAGFQTFAASHIKGSLNPNDALSADQITPEAQMALTIMLHWSRKDEYLGYVNNESINELFASVGYDPADNGTETGFIVLNGIPYKKYEDVLEKARTMDESEFTKYTYELLLKSDIKRFIIVITRFLNILPDQKHKLLDRVLNHDDFDFFYTLAGVPNQGYSAIAETVHAVAIPAAVSAGMAAGVGADVAGSAHRAAPTAMGGAGAAPNYGAAAAAAPSPQTYDNVNLNELLYDVEWDSLSKSKTPVEFENHLSILSPTSIENVIKKIRSNVENKVNIAEKINELFTYYDSNKLKIPEHVAIILEKIIPFLSSSGGGRRRRTIARRRRAQKTRKHKRV